MVHSREPTPAEMEAISKETRLVFESFSSSGRKNVISKCTIMGKSSPGDPFPGGICHTMVELDWVPVGLSPEKPSEISIVTAPCFI